MFRLPFGHKATKLVAPVAAVAALFAGSINAPAQAGSSFGAFNPADFGFTMPSVAGPAAPAPHAAASVQGLINQTNAQRVANGLAPLRVDPNLTNLAQDWANTLSRDGRTRHRPNYWTFYPAGLPAGGENVLQAWSDYSDASLVKLWMDSPGHRKNLLDPRAKSVGIGLTVAPDGRLYAVQNFGR
ncbi:CAP domain-containing protein [Corynebacterium aurimucosum]|nr:CAP domain-containing protein [Corynebacterium aurimucosum]